QHQSPRSQHNTNTSHSHSSCLGELLGANKEFIPHHPCRPDAPLSPGEVQDASSPLEDTTRPFP
ncbi:hypothetical protein LINPERHAP2_LOCUS9235, partial [Linum perenne]